MYPCVDGSHDLEVSDCIIEYTGSCGSSYGIYLEDYGTVADAISISATVEDTIITGWNYGVYWVENYDSPCGTINVDANCEGISGNTSGNVVELHCSSGTGTCDDIEQCRP